MRLITGVTLLMLCGTAALAVSPRASAAAEILVWMPKTEASSESLINRLIRLMDVVYRMTSPDVPLGLRRLWRMSADGGGRCRIGADRGVRAPKWGTGGFVLYLQEVDASRDGQIDNNDEDLVRVISAEGGDLVLVGQGRSAAWSPDGRVVAISRSDGLEFRNLHGQLVPPQLAPEGDIVVTNSLDPELAREFWAIDARSAERRRLPDELGKKYLWLPKQAPAGKTALFASATRQDLLLVGPGDQKPREITQDRDLFIDPSWSPDEQQIVFVSKAPDGELCRVH